MHILVIPIIKELKTLDQKNSHNAVVIQFSVFLLISSFSTSNTTLVNIFLNNIGLFVIFFFIFNLIMALELLPNSPLGYQMPHWVIYIHIYTRHEAPILPM